MDEKALVSAFRLAGINGHVFYDACFRRLEVRFKGNAIDRTKGRYTHFIDPSPFAYLINQFFDEHKKEILAK